MQLEQALTMEKSGKKTGYRTYLYMYLDGEMKAEIFTAMDAEKALESGWFRNPAEALGEEKVKEKAKESFKSLDVEEGLKVSAFKEAIQDVTIQTNRLLNFDAIEDIDILKEICEPVDYKGEKLSDQINWNIKGRRKYDHVKMDVKKALDELGMLNGDGEANN